MVPAGKSGFETLLEILVHDADNSGSEADQQLVSGVVGKARWALHAVRIEQRQLQILCCGLGGDLA